jgi:hypothetical protein
MEKGPEFDEWIRGNPGATYSAFRERFPLSSISSGYFRHRKNRLLTGRKRDRKEEVGPQVEACAGAAPSAPFLTDKKEGRVEWRKYLHWIRDGQELEREGSWGQDFARIEFPDIREPILVLPFSDAHMGAWSADVELFERITDEVLSLPNVYLMLLGDLAEMAIRLRGVGEVTNQVIKPSTQLAVIESWLNDIEDRVLLATWDNHAVEREERGSGISGFQRLLSRRVIYHDGIGHVDILIGKEVYKIAVTHRFQGRSYMNPTHGPSRYMRMQGIDREIAVQGDLHTPGKQSYYDGSRRRLAITCGSLHLQSQYARRYFSLFSIPAFPCFELHPEEHLFPDFWSLQEWRKVRGK